MSARPQLAFDTRTDVGRQRDQNEDACGDAAAAGGQLVIVCDGMGGHEAGEVASRIAVDTIAQIFQNSTEEDPGERLRRGFLVANQRILKHADEQGLERMGTTATAVFVRDGEAWIAHVGDSRVYHLRGGAVLWRTSDHTRVQKMVERGILTAAEAKTHEDANIVTRALGFAKGEEAPEPDVAPRPLREGDTVLLCSDGLHDLVNDDEIAELSSYAPPDEVTATLVELANRRGGHDNITVGVLRWGDAKLARPAGARTTALEFGEDVPAPLQTLDGTRRAPARSDGGAKGAKPSTAKGDGGAKGTATATDVVAREDDRPRRAALLVIAGVALVGLAAAVYLMTRGGGGARGGGGVGASDGGAVRIPDDAAGGSAAAGRDAGAASPTAVIDDGDGGVGQLAPWTDTNRPRPRPGPGSGTGSGSGPATAAGSGSAPGSGSGSGSGSAPGSGSGSAPASGSGSGSGAVNKGGSTTGSGSGKPATRAPATTTKPPASTTAPTTTPPPTTPKPPTTPRPPTTPPPTTPLPTTTPSTTTPSTTTPPPTTTRPPSTPKPPTTPLPTTTPSTTTPPTTTPPATTTGGPS
jgi:protein phosphatase